MYESGEPMKLCKCCGETKPLHLMVKHSGGGYKDGVRPLCKECKQKQVKERIQKIKEVAKTTLIPSVQLTATQRNSLGLTGYVKRERLPNEALGPQINKLAGFYEPPKSDYYRNDGLKHIPSRGF